MTEANTNFPYILAIAGLRILTNRPVAAPAAPINQGYTIHVIFTTEQLEGTLSTSALWRRLPDGLPVPAYVRRDGLAAAVQEPRNRDLDYAAQLRRVVPFAAALQDRLILHASAVRFQPLAKPKPGNHGAGPPNAKGIGPANAKGIGPANAKGIGPAKSVGPDAVAAFIGATGSGKSTLAGQLAQLGYPVVADDLTPCLWTGKGMDVLLTHGDAIRTAGFSQPSVRNAERARPPDLGRPLDISQPPDPSRPPVGNADVSQPPGFSRPPATGSPESLPMAAIYFLCREPAKPRLQCIPLSARSCLLELLRHGFGELPVASAWKNQFQAYHRIARYVPAFSLHLPDDLDRLEESALFLITHFSQLGDPILKQQTRTTETLSDPRT